MARRSAPGPGRIRVPARAALLLLLLPALAGAPATARKGPGGEPPARGAPGASVRLLSPSAGEVVFGSMTLSVEVLPPAGAEVRGVEIFVDGALVGAVASPPYEIRWEAGEDLASHRFRALAAFSDGSSAEDAITTRGLAFAEYELVEGTPIEHVELLVSVTDGEGAPVSGLGAGDFRVLEEGSPLEILGCRPLEERREIPLSVAVLVDRSGSVRFQMREWRAASLELLQALRPIDQIRVAAFSSEMVILQDFTRDAASLAASLEKIGPAAGSTRLFQSLFETARDMRDLPGRKAILVLTDGVDTQIGAARGRLTVDMHSNPILVDTARMASRAGVTIVVIFPGPTGRGYLPVQDLALQTGGWYTYSSEDLGALMRRLGERLLSAYLLGYDVARPEDPDARRRVEVLLRGDRPPEWRVRSALRTYGGIDRIESLEEDLRAGNDRQRARAALEIGRLHAERSVPLLLEALRDGSPDVRRAALEALGERRDPEALEEVIERVHDADRWVRQAAFAAAVQYGPAALEELERTARSLGPARAPALRALGEIGDLRAVGVLESALEARGCDVRAAAAEGAGRLYELAGGAFARDAGPGRHPSAEPLRTLLRALGDPCAEASLAAALALGRTRHPVALPRLLETAALPAPSPERNAAMETLAAYVTPEVVEALEEALRPEEGEEAGARARLAAAVRTVERIGTKEGMRELIAVAPGSVGPLLEDLLALAGGRGVGPSLASRIEEIGSRLAGARARDEDDSATGARGGGS